MKRRRVSAVGAARAAWAGLLLLPALTCASAWHDWDIEPAAALAASAWTLIVLRLLLPGGAFFVLSYPLALASLACVAADLLRHVDLLELAAQWRTFSALDIRSAWAPYALPMAVAAAVLAAWAAWCTRVAHPAPAADVEHTPAPGTGPSPWRRRLLLAFGGSAIVAAILPSLAWTRAWPNSGVVLAASAAAGQPQWAGLAMAGAGGDPGRPDDDWGAVAASARPQTPSTPPLPTTVVLVIGESLRADVLRECGGPAAMRSVAPGALVACDMSAGSSATHTSVPLLVGRSWPGQRTRIPHDATFQRPLERHGFHTAWITTQSLDVAWPDARERILDTRADAQVLPAALDRQLLAHAGRPLSVVLHMTGAHEPYCVRFDRARAPLGDACATIGDAPDRATLGAWRAMYANAADASIGTLNALIARLAQAAGPAFLAFTPDHGENLRDDARGLHGHALRTPTSWDTRVPAVFWANEAWKQAHPAAWERLARNVSRPLMHADVVPTLMHAAGLRFVDERPAAVNLLESEVGPRQRVVQVSLGRVVPVDDLAAAQRAPVDTAPWRTLAGPGRADGAVAQRADGAVAQGTDGHPAPGTQPRR